MWNELKRIYKCRDVVFHLTSSDLQAAHRNKLLGNLWALLDPLLMMAVLFFVFHKLHDRPIDFTLFILSGLVVWNFFLHYLTNSATCIRRQKNLILKVPLPMAIFPLSMMLRHLNDLIWGFAAYTLMKIVLQAPLWSYLYYLWLPVLVGIFCLFVLGLALIISCLGVFFLDMPNILGVVFRLGFFLNPIFWEMNSILPAKYHHIYLILNPVAGYLLLFRNVLLAGNAKYEYDFSIPYYIPYLIILSIGTFIVGLYIFHRTQGHYAKYI